MRNLRNTLVKTPILKFLAAGLMVCVFLVSTPITVSASSTPIVDIKINGSDGPVTITVGKNFTYSWSSEDVSACQLTSPSGESGVSLDGSGGPIVPAHPWYPAVGGSTTLTLN